MGKRGPVGAPTNLRLLRGDAKCRINDREPTPRDILPEPPRGMTKEVRDIWDYTLRELVHMKLATAADRDSLVCYCEAVVTHRKASEILARSPILVKGLHTTLVRNPALQIQRDAAATIRNFAQEFGLTPSARAGIKTEGHNDGSNGKPNPFSAIG
jgi:P27 family predicted phage terminase small subunit